MNAGMHVMNCANSPSSATGFIFSLCHVFHYLVDAITQGVTSMVVVVMGHIKYKTKKPRSECFSQTFIMTTQVSAAGGESWKIAKDCFRLLA